MWLFSGGGSNASAVSHLRKDGSNESVTIPGGRCTGQGYTSAPQVRLMNWHGWLRFQGQNQGNTILKLKDRAPGFTNPNCSINIDEREPRQRCKAVLYAASEISGDSTGAGEDAYDTDIQDLTIDTGRGNAGTVGLHWIGSNRAAVRNVTVRSGDGQGRAGVDLKSGSSGDGGGPALLKNLTVEGFDYGITSGFNLEVGYTFEHITLRNQRIAGFLNQNLSAWIRDLRSQNTVPAVINRNTGAMTLLDSRLAGGSRANSAILNQGEKRAGQLFVRNVVVSGYAGAIRQGVGTGPRAGAIVARSSRVDEYAFPGVKSLFDSRRVSMDLPIQETPEYHNNDFSQWAIVTEYGAKPDDDADDSAGIQAALDSGKPVVFFPFGAYRIARTLHIPGSVRLIEGTNSQLSGAPRVATVFACDAKTGGPIIVRDFNFDIETTGSPAIHNSCSVPFVMVDLFNVNRYVGDGGGDVFWENCAITGVEQHGGRF